MSSLRNESLRLVWLEAFLKVAETENISAAARELGVNQSTVSRYMIALRKWAGRPLIDLHTEIDKEDADRLSRMTPAGGELYSIIHELVPQLADFRDQKSQRGKLIATMEKLTIEMMADLTRRVPSQAARSLEDAIVRVTEDYVSVSDDRASFEDIEKVCLAVRRVYAKYEHQLKLEQRAARRKSKPSSAAHIDMSATRRSSPRS